MKFNTVATAVTAALLTGVARADESSDGAKSAAPGQLPSFTPTKIKAEFLEQFTDDWETRWKPSHAKKDMKGSDSTEQWAYVGEWSVEEPAVYKGMQGDKGLVVKNAAAHHAISAKFPKKIDNKGKTLVVQYEVKLQNGLECGGAYLKLLRENKALHHDEFSNTTPYVIMFGPDKCGHTNKVHFIINHKNPKTGEYEEKHLSSPPAAKIVKTSELYTLIVHPNNTYALKQNNEEVKSGSLFSDFEPSINPDKEIDDPSDKKPEDWDDEEDGDWIAPTVPNPKCADISGCGPWEKPMKQNPDYKGKWTAPYIDNPAYKGVWAPKKIKNPNYYEDKTPSNLEPMGAIGFEIWTMQNNIMFDNIYIGHSVEDAAKLAEESWKPKHAAEVALEEADKPKEEEKPAAPGDLKFTDDPVLYIREKLSLFLTLAKKDPIEAIKFVPDAAAGLAAVIAAIGFALFTALGGGAAPAVKKAASDAKDKAKAAKDKAGDAAATGADTAKAEVTKRTTRSQQS